MRISGDTIYYADPQNAPVYFKVLRDTIYLRGNTLTAYKIAPITRSFIHNHTIFFDYFWSAGDNFHFLSRECQSVFRIIGLI